MRKYFIAATTVALSFSAVAQQAQCVNPNLVNGLIFLGRSDAKVNVTHELPAVMSSFHTPTGFSLIGTGTRASMTTVAYKSSLTTDKAFAAVITALGAEGWANDPSSGAAATFNVTGGRKEGALCRNGERRLVVAMDSAGATYVNVVLIPEARSRDCNAPNMPMPFLPGRSAAPRFQFPAGTSLAQAGGGGSSGSGGSNISSSSTRIISEETPARLVEHLSSQLESQEWRRDAGWSGSSNAGSTWRKTGDSAPASGTLVITRISDRTYEVDFMQITQQ